MFQAFFQYYITSTTYICVKYSVIYHIIYINHICITYIPPHTSVYTFSLSPPRSFLSSLLFNCPGAWAFGKDEWKMKSLPEQLADFIASKPAVITGPNTTSVCVELLNNMGICSIKLKINIHPMERRTWFY